MRVAVVGHVEWVEFAVVERLPEPGEIVHASETFQEPAGGGAVAAVQLAKLAGSATFFTALGDDEHGHRAERRLHELGVDLRAVFRPEPQRRGFVHLDGDGERTITVLGPRLGPRGGDPLPWELLDDTDGVYLTAGDAEAIRHARRARALVASARALPTLSGSGVELDVLVASGKDAGERYEAGQLDPPPRYVVRTMGAAGGSWETPDGSQGDWESTPLPGPLVDVFGSGDSFAAGLTYGMAESGDIAQAVQIAARCGAACATGRGPYEGQLRLA
jgi:ribokinase